MKRVSLIVAFSGLLIFIAASCGNLSHNKSKNNKTDNTVANEGSITSSSNGLQIYQQKCVACHQLNGTGIAGTFPPLKGSDFLKNVTKKRLIEQVMKGSNGGITVNGVKYSTSMPPQVDNAQDAVAVVNYILNAWGNNYGKATLRDAQGVKPKKGNSHMMRRGGMMSGGMGRCR